MNVLSVAVGLVSSLGLLIGCSSAPMSNEGPTASPGPVKLYHELALLDLDEVTAMVKAEIKD